MGTSRTNHSLFAALALALATACGGDRPPDVLLVSLDTLRADSLSCYGYERGTSPFLDTIAAEGARFAHAWASASNTAPSHMSLLTGLDPLAHGVRPVLVTDEPVRSLTPDSPTLAEVLSDAGYRTVGLVDNGYVITSMGFDRGFDVFRNKRTTLGKKVTQLRTELIEADPDRPLFLFFHTYETHAPYLPPRNHQRRFTDASYRGEFRQRYVDLVDLPLAQSWEARSTFLVPPEGMNDDDLAFLRGLYDAGIAYTDELMARAWKLWKQRRDPENTLFVVLSDHGEGFGEHRGKLGHRHSLYGELLHVPLLVRGPGVPAQVVVEDVSLTDLVPTLLEYLDLPPVHGVQGRSFLELLRGEGGSSSIAVSQLSRPSGSLHDSATRSPWRLIRWQKETGTQIKLYDRSTDVRESVNLAEERDDVVAELIEHLDERSATGLAYSERHRPGNAGEVSDETRRDLESLGYTGYGEED